jgi:hypothetical protein
MVYLHNFLEIDTDPVPAKLCGSDPFRTRIHNTMFSLVYCCDWEYMIIKWSTPPFPDRV